MILKKRKPLFITSLSTLTLSILTATSAHAQVSAVLPTLVIEGMDENDPTRTYIDYQQASVTRNNLNKKDIPQTIDTIDVQKYKLYGANDLSVMLQGTPGVSTSYDMRGDGIMLRGFSADSSDIYRDGNRESGQVRRSTANVERIEILKGPASVLYGRSGGGGVINMVTKYANFNTASSFGAYAGSYDNKGVVVDINEVISDHWAVRLTGEHGKTESFRQGIESEINMLSPSFTYNNQNGLTWTAQYTYDKLHRIPDRGPAFQNLPEGTSIKTGFAQDGDFVDDKLQVIRSNLRYDLSDTWQIHWAASYREAYQNFDHFYLGTYCATEFTPVRTGGACAGHVGEISQVYYWQETSNSTLANTLELQGEFMTGALRHQLTVGFDYSIEEREPKLANENRDGSPIFGYVNPLTGERTSTRGSGDLQIRTHNYAKGTSSGLFMQDLISLRPDLDLMLGLRYDHYKSQAQNRLLSSDDINYQRSISDQTLSPNLGVVWRPALDHALYASYSRSFAPFGGRVSVNTVSANQNLELFDAEPQYNDQYETGVKSDWLNERLSTQLSLFDIRKHNIRYRPDPDADPYLWAVQGEQQSRGLELSFIGRVTDNVYLRGGYGYNKATVKEDKASPGNNGKSLAGVARHTGNLFVRYLPNDNTYGEIGVTHVGDTWTNLSNTTKLDGFNRVDAAVGYNMDQWRMTLAVSNLLDKEYWRSNAMPGTPRSLLFRVNYTFD
ncbi:TonB-dependent receptor [Nitrincola alkalilacustris]|uniref:TonB-dependent receptor n=1 Tax=Nitrincola alkalilacustris TaxID=1571224 RepID=UPI00124E069B|nr:TonB-dependent receptor [Nitrincola alkalilacustris]